MFFSYLNLQTYVFDAEFWKREADVESSSYNHVGWCDENVSQCHVAALGFGQLSFQCCLYFPLRLTLFSWCLLLLMMVMMALWMNRARVKIPRKWKFLVRKARRRWRRTYLSNLEMLTWQVGWTLPRWGQRSWRLFPTHSSEKVQRREWTWWKPFLIKTTWNIKFVAQPDFYPAHWTLWRM